MNSRDAEDTPSTISVMRRRKTFASSATLPAVGAWRHACLAHIVVRDESARAKRRSKHRATRTPMGRENRTRRLASDTTNPPSINLAFSAPEIRFRTRSGRFAPRVQKSPAARTGSLAHWRLKSTTMKGNSRRSPSRTRRWEARCVLQITAQDDFGGYIRLASPGAPNRG